MDNSNLHRVINLPDTQWRIIPAYLGGLGGIFWAARLVDILIFKRRKNAVHWLLGLKINQLLFNKQAHLLLLTLSCLHSNWIS